MVKQSYHKTFSLSPLKLVVKWLLGINSTVFDLVVYLENVGFSVVKWFCTDQLVTAAQVLCGTLAPKCRRNAVTIVLNWRCLHTLISILGRHREDSLKAMFSLSTDEKKLLPSLPKDFGNRYHLDRNMRELSVADPSLATICGRSL